MVKHIDSSQDGRSLIEMLGVLGIIGVLSLGGLVGYSKALGMFKTQKIMEQVSSISANIHSLYLQQSTYSDLSNETASNAGLIPDELGSGEYLINPFSGNFKISTGKASEFEDASAKTAFYLIYEGLSQQACVNLAAADWKDSNTNLIGIGVYGNNTPLETIEEQAKNLHVNHLGEKGTDYALATSKSNTIPIPIPLSVAADTCNCSQRGTSCSIFFKFY